MVKILILINDNQILIYTLYSYSIRNKQTQGNQKHNVKQIFKHLRPKSKSPKGKNQVPPRRVKQGGLASNG